VLAATTVTTAANASRMAIPGRLAFPGRLAGEPVPRPFTWAKPGAAVPRPAARIMPLPGRPHRRLTTGVRAGAAGHPAIRAFREALRQAIRDATAAAG